MDVADDKLLEATKRMASRDVAPSPDGIPGLVWAEPINILAPRLRRLFTRCLREGVSLPGMADGETGSIKEGGSPLGFTGGVQAVCFLDEVGKLLERIIAIRLKVHILE